MPKPQAKALGVIKNKEGVINIDETLFQKRNLFLYSVVGNDICGALICQLMLLDSLSHDPIYLYINSPGGSVDDGFALIDVMKTIKSPVITVAQGVVASMAALIFIAGKKRHFHRHSVLMFHDMAGGVSDYSAKMEARMEFMKKEWDAIKNHVNEYTKLSDSECEKMRSGELWLFAEDAKAKGCADEII